MAGAWGVASLSAALTHGPVSRAQEQLAPPVYCAGFRAGASGSSETEGPTLHDDSRAESGTLAFVTVRAADEPRDAADYFRPLSAPRKTLAALQQPAELDFLDQPLEVVLEAIEVQSGVAFEFDESGLEEVAITSDAEVTVQLRNMSFAAALGLLLRDLDLDYVVADDYVLITSQERASAARETRTYAIVDHPLLCSGDALKFARTVRQHVELACAAEKQSVAIDVLPGVLVVSANQKPHEAAESFLQQYAQALAAYDVASATSANPASAQPVSEPHTVPSNGSPTAQQALDPFAPSADSGR